MKFTDYLSSLLESTLKLNSDGGLEFVNDTQDGISTKFGKGSALKPFSKLISIGDVKIEANSLYLAKSEDSVSIMKQLKLDSNTETEVAKKFIVRSAVYGARVLRGSGIDVIIVPKSSSKLNTLFAEELGKRLNVPVIHDSFDKNPDLSTLEIADDPRVTPQIRKSLTNSIETAKKRGVLKLAAIPPMFRKFLRNVFVVIDKDLNKKVEDKNVLVVDDVVTSGTSLEQVYTLISSGAKNVSAMTLFKSQK